MATSTQSGLIKHSGIVVPLDAANVDTDAIIPKQFLQKVTRNGFKVVIAPSFADIFYGNSFNNQLLPVTLREAEIDELFAQVEAAPGMSFTVDLETQTVQAGDKSYSFELDSFRRHCMMNGLDSIGLTLQHEAAISEYEGKLPEFLR